MTFKIYYWGFTLAPVTEKVLCILFVFLNVVIFPFWYFRGTCPSAFVTQLQLPWGSSPLTLSKHTNTSMRLVLFFHEIIYRYNLFVTLYRCWKLWTFKSNKTYFHVQLCELFCCSFIGVLCKKEATPPTGSGWRLQSQKREESL